MNYCSSKARKAFGAVMRMSYPTASAIVFLGYSKVKKAFESPDHCC